MCLFYFNKTVISTFLFVCFLLILELDIFADIRIRRRLVQYCRIAKRATEKKDWNFCKKKKNVNKWNKLSKNKCCSLGKVFHQNKDVYSTFLQKKKKSKRKKQE